jgi:putative ABC transport system permease protein
MVAVSTTTPTPVRNLPPYPAPEQRPALNFGEIVRFAYDTFCSNKIRFALTALGMVIGNASLILVVTIGMTGKQYILNEIQAIGANMVYVTQEGTGNKAENTIAQEDLLSLNDMSAIREQVPGIRAASPLVELHDRIPVGNGKERDVLILGVSPEYLQVRNLDVPTGRFFDDEDTHSRNKVAVATQKFAIKQFGSEEEAIGRRIQLNGLPFTIIGTFRERVETFGQSGIADETLLIPYTVAQYFTGSEAVNQIYFSLGDSSDVPQATQQIRRVIQSRHRPETVYRVDNLTELLDVAAKSANALTLVLLLVAMVTLVVSGVGIMNIMLATVTSRIREIGVRKAIGATNREIKFQFMAEAMFISLAGGILGIMIGLALPLSVRWFTAFRIPISGLSAIIAIMVSTIVGVVFGTVPATRAAQLDPVESLRYE